MNISTAASFSSAFTAKSYPLRFRADESSKALSTQKNEKLNADEMSDEALETQRVAYEKMLQDYLSNPDAPTNACCTPSRGLKSAKSRKSKVKTLSCCGSFQKPLKAKRSGKSSSKGQTQAAACCRTPKTNTPSTPSWKSSLHHWLHSTDPVEKFIGHLVDWLTWIIQGFIADLKLIFHPH